MNVTQIDPTSPPAPDGPPRHRRRWKPLAAIIVVVALAGGLWLDHRRADDARQEYDDMIQNFGS